MKRFLMATALASALFLPACNCGVQIDPEGLLCTATGDDACPTGFLCGSDSRCHASDAGSGGTGGGGAGGLGGGGGSGGTGGGGAGGGGGGDACAMTGCVTPPAQACLSTTTLRRYSATGTCNAGVCSYTTMDTICPNGCANAQCTGNPCAGVNCTVPPAPTCVAGRVRTFSAGSCAPSSGMCSFPSTDAPCANGCANAACIPTGLSLSSTSPRLSFAVRAVDVAPNSSGNNIIAVGAAGAMARWDGSKWSTLASGTTQTLNDIWFASGTTAIAVGEGKTVLRVSGSTVTPVVLPAQPSDAGFVGVHGLSENQYVFADNVGNWWRSNIGVITTGSFDGVLKPYRIAGVTMNDLGRVRAYGQATVGGSPQGFVGFYSGTSWYEMLSGDSAAFIAAGPTLNVTGSSDDAFVATSTTVSRHLAGPPPGWNSTFTTAAPALASEGPAVAITGSATGSTLYFTTPTRLFRQTTAGGSLERLAYWGGALKSVVASHSESGGVVVAEVLGTANNVFRRNGATNFDAYELADSDWVDVVNGPTGLVTFIGARGDVAQRTAVGGKFFYGQARLTLPGTSDVRAATWSSTGGFGLMVGGGGQVIRFTSAASGFTAVNPSGVTDYNAVCRVSDTEFYVAGENGVIRRYDGSVLSAPMPTGTTKVLRALDCTTYTAPVACGQDGTILRLSNGTWSALTPSFPTPTAQLLSCHGLAGALYVAGDNVFAKLEGTSWVTTLPSRPGLRALHVAGVNEAYAIASGNQVVRYDGTGWITKATATGAILRGGGLVGGKVVYVGTSGAVLENP